MNIRAPFHFPPAHTSTRAPQVRRYRSALKGRLRSWCMDRYLDWEAIKRKWRTRRACRRWSTPEAQRAYTAGLNLGAIMGIGYCTFLAMLLVTGLWLTGSGL